MKTRTEAKDTYSTKEVANQCGCTPRTVQKWAAANKVSYTGEGRRKDYHFTKAEIELFTQRPRPGRRWPEKEDSTQESSPTP
jgi:uncharacterized protein YjcR